MRITDTNTSFEMRNLPAINVHKIRISYFLSILYEFKVEHQLNALHDKFVCLNKLSFVKAWERCNDLKAWERCNDLVVYGYYLI